MGRQQPSDIHELVGAYALNALEGDEAEEFEAHLASCPRCRAELRDHRETAAMLSYAGADAPEGVWERIAAQLDEAPPDMARVLSFATPKPPGRMDPARRRRIVAALSVAAALIVALNSAVLIQQRSQIHRLQPSRAASLSALADRALTEPSARRTTLLLPDGSVAGVAVVTENGQGYVAHLALKTLDGEHTYQLWGLTSAGRAVSLGILGAHPDVASFAAKVDIATLAITVERAEGAYAPTAAPVVSGALQRT
jgi:anti-sigma-K factor RskA